MTGEDHWIRVRELFAEALEQPPDERARFVFEHCTGHPRLLDTLTRLLEADRVADAEFLNGLDPSILAALREEPAYPERIGSWRVLRPIGAGGMGSVLLAERVDGQFQQRVAIKLLRRGMDSDVTLARFLLERQILAGLEHPHIARLLGGGIAGDGRPYIVMELVDGLPITRYCEEHRLPVDQRLALFGTVCLAVEYAHRNLVVHRDLKPSNILVTGEGVPKLLDFGIAKLLPSPEDSAPATTLTQLGGRLLTPAYASPEQLRGGPITTSSDVYSMGAVLYEVLSGQHAWPGRARLEDRLGTLDQDPPPMSSRVTDPDLRRRLTGDLDLIVARALHSVPERRYHSMEALREDVRRHRERRPVLARPDTLGYQASRFVRRHRAAVGWATALVLLVLAFTITATVQGFRIRRQSDQLAVERDRAQQEAATSRAVADFLVDVFEVSDPEVVGTGDSLTARALLDQGAAQIETGLAAHGELRARLLGVMGRAYANLLLPKQAEPLLLRSVDLWRAAGPPGMRGLIMTLQQLAHTRWNSYDYPGAEQALRDALATAGGDPALVWSLYVDLATVFHARGAVDRAVAAADSALLVFRSAQTPDFVPGRGELDQMAELFLYTRQWNDAERTYAQLVELEARERGDRSQAMAKLYNRWAGARNTAGRRPAGDSLHRLALAIQLELSPRSVSTAKTLGLLASNALMQQRPEQADSFSRAAVEIYLEQLGEDHHVLNAERARLAEIMRGMGKYEEAVRLLESALASYRRSGSTGAPLIPRTEWRLGAALVQGGWYARSLQPLQSALNHFEGSYPADFLSTAHLRRDYGTALLGLGRGTESVSQLERAIDVLARRYDSTDARVDGTRITLARAMAVAGRRAQADSLLTEVTGRLSSSRGPDDSLTVQARTALSQLRRPRPTS